MFSPWISMSFSLISEFSSPDCRVLIPDRRGLGWSYRFLRHTRNGSPFRPWVATTPPHASVSTRIDLSSAGTILNPGHESSSDSPSKRRHSGCAQRQQGSEAQPLGGLIISMDSALHFPVHSDDRANQTTKIIRSCPT